MDEEFKEISQYIKKVKDVAQYIIYRDEDKKKDALKQLKKLNARCKENDRSIFKERK